MLEKYKIEPTCTIKEAIEIMEKNNGASVFVVNQQNYLLGIFTPGDMRRYILRSNDLTQKITNAMNATPIVFESLESAKKEQKKQQMVVYPIVNKKGELVDAIFNNQLESEEEIVNHSLNKIPLVIMAGGKGTRLYPYTKVLPKALIPIGDYTITERIINQFCRYGCNKVFFILNHKANMIEAYFNDIEKSYSTEYVKEKEFLGTGGGLSLLKGKINTTFIVSNCDILVNADLECIYQMHKKQSNKITLVCAMKNIIIPYGTIKTDEDGMIVKMDEKPEFSFLTNTGVYFIEPEVIDELDGQYIDLPDIVKKYLGKENIGVFPISEHSWMDMGQFNEMESMIEKFDT